MCCAEGRCGSNTGGTVGLDTCVICGLHTPEPLSRLGRVTVPILQHVTLLFATINTADATIRLAGS